MARLYNTCEFIGNISIPKDKNKFHEVISNGKGWEGHKLNFGIKESNTNSVYLEVFGGYSTDKENKVYSFSKGGNGEKGIKVEVPWDDRMKPGTIDMIADFKKVVVDLTTDFKLKEEVNKLRFEMRKLEFKEEGMTEADKEKYAELKSQAEEKSPDRKEFIHDYDVVNYLSSVLEDYKAYKFKINGNIEVNEHKGRFFRKFKPQTIEIVDNEERNKLFSIMDIFFTKDSLDEADFKKEKKIYINGYIISYDSKAKKDAFFPQQFLIDAQKIDFENEKHVGRLNVLKKQFVQKGKGVYHLPWEVNIYRGAEKAEFTYKDLTSEQKEAVHFELNKVEDFAPKGGAFGENIEENRLKKPLLKTFNKANDFTTGALETDYDAEDLEYITTADESYKDVAKKEEPKEEKSTEKEKVDVDLEDLFG